MITLTTNAALSSNDAHHANDNFILSSMPTSKLPMPESSFKEKARRHQIKFRENILKVGYSALETILRDEDAKTGLIFFDGFRVIEAALDRYPHYKLQQACFANMLRSEHIPFNFFIPLSKNKEVGRAVLNKFLGGTVSLISDVRIEYAPDQAKALMDKTSFDVFIEYKHKSGEYGVLGIVVKYTEKEYRLIKKSKEEMEINLESSIYNILTAKSGLYKNEFLPELKIDKFRQLWRNQLLGESLTNRNHPDSRYKYFTSIILYPSGNEHFNELIPAYKNFLAPGHEQSFTGITYEEFIKAGGEVTEDTEFLRWLQYLEDRYIVQS